MSTYPDLSRQFKRVYKDWFESNCDFETGIKLVDHFLKKNPNYPEALLFKARLLIGIDNKAALKLLRGTRKVDQWRAASLFDEAETLYKLGKKDQAAKTLETAVQKLLDESSEGVMNFLMGTCDNEKHRSKLFKLTLTQMIEYLSNGRKRMNLRQLLSKSLKK